MRDLETAENAVQAALTGHLVLSTLHTNDASSSITRLLDLGVPPFLIQSTLVGIMAQRLVRKICNHCMESFDMETAELRTMGLDVAKNGRVTLYRGKGLSEMPGDRLLRENRYFRSGSLFGVVEKNDKRQYRYRNHSRSSQSRGDGFAARQCFEKTAHRKDHISGGAEGYVGTALTR